jgi:hypothetical protein
VGLWAERVAVGAGRDLAGVEGVEPALEARLDASLSAQVGGRAMVFAEEGVEVIFNQLLGIGTIHVD